MVPSVCLCLFLLTAFAASLQQPYGNARNTIEQVTGERLKRMALSQIVKLIKSAMLIDGKRGYQVYLKNGGLKQAEKDFSSLYPSGVKEYKYARTGKSGDSSITLLFADKDPVLTIRTTTNLADDILETTTKKIVYLKSKTDGL